MPYLSQFSAVRPARRGPAGRHLAAGGLGVPQAEPVVVLGEKEDVAHACFLGSAGPLVGIAAGGAETAMSFTPGVHSLPEKVLNDQQTNIPHLRLLSSSAQPLHVNVVGGAKGGGGKGGDACRDRDEAIHGWYS